MLLENDGSDGDRHCIRKKGDGKLSDQRVVVEQGDDWLHRHHHRQEQQADHQLAAVRHQLAPRWEKQH